MYEVEFIEFKSLSYKDILETLSFLGYHIGGTPLVVLQMSELVERIQADGYLILNTLEGAEKVYVSEFIIKGVEGEFYPVKPENFVKVYDVL